MGYPKSKMKVAIAVSVVVLVVVAISLAKGPHGSVLLTQQDAVQSFDLITGTGFQTGTATGTISGTTFVSFQFLPSGPPSGDALPVTFANKVIVTDIDGDQIFFDNNGTGTLHLGGPGPFHGSGGPMTGTYVVTGGTGKYQSWVVGTTFNYSAIYTNPPTPPGGLGNAYVKITRPSDSED